VARRAYMDLTGGLSIRKIPELESYYNILATPVSRGL